MERKRVIRLFRELSKELGINNVRIRIVPMKRKVASISLKTRILRLNRNLISDLSENQLKFIILHEQIHLKTGDPNHSDLFFEELGKFYRREDLEKIELEIVRTMLNNAGFNLKVYFD